MADVKVIGSGASELNIVSPVTSNYLSAAFVNDYRQLYRLKIVVGTVTGTNPTLTPQLQGANADGTSFFAIGPAQVAMTASGTYVFTWWVDSSDSPVSDRLLKLALNTGGTSPNFTITSAVLYGMKFM